MARTTGTWPDLVVYVFCLGVVAYVASPGHLRALQMCVCLYVCVLDRGIWGDKGRAYGNTRIQSGQRSHYSVKSAYLHSCSVAVVAVVRVLPLCPKLNNALNSAYPPLKPGPTNTEQRPCPGHHALRFCHLCAELLSLCHQACKHSLSHTYTLKNRLAQTVFAQRFAVFAVAFVASSISISICSVCTELQTPLPAPAPAPSADGPSSGFYSVPRTSDTSLCGLINMGLPPTYNLAHTYCAYGTLSTSSA